MVRHIRCLPPPPGSAARTPRSEAARSWGHPQCGGWSGAPAGDHGSATQRPAWCRAAAVPLQHRSRLPGSGQRFAATGCPRDTSQPPCGWLHRPVHTGAAVLSPHPRATGAAGAHRGGPDGPRELLGALPRRQHRSEIQVVMEHRIAMGSRPLHQRRRPSAAGSIRSTRSCQRPVMSTRRLAISPAIVPTVMLGLMPGNGKGKRSGASITTRATATRRRLHRIPLGQGLAKRLVTSAIGRSALPQA